MPENSNENRIKILPAFLDEADKLFLKPSQELKDHMKKVRILSNQHLLNEDKTDLKPSAIIKQSLNDLQ